jgi:NAD(P)-dependent dehydrogenase (short-subunit alcohol dehydrogenase family)
MKNILITGVSTGIGYHSAKYFIEQGFFVFGSVRKEADAQRVSADLGANFQALIFDVTDQEAIDLAAESVEEQLGDAGLDLLVNNAGIAVSGPLQYLTIDELHHQMNVNVYGVLRVTKAFLPILGAKRPRKHSPGKIINISSVSGFVSAPFLGAYAMSKHALESMSDALRRELSIYDIDVIVIEPGAIKTDIWEKSQNIDPKFLKTEYAPILKDWDKMIKNSEKNGLPAKDIAMLLHRILEKARPATRHIIAKKKFVMWMVKHILPDRFLDGKLTEGWKEKLKNG